MGTHLYSTEICYQVVRHVTKSHASSVLRLAEEPVSFGSFGFSSLPSPDSSSHSHIG